MHTHLLAHMHRKKGRRKKGGRKKGRRKEGRRKKGGRKKGRRKEGGRKKGRRKEGGRKKGGKGLVYIASLQECRQMHSDSSLYKSHDC